jgi:hypothetical protein
MTAVDRAATGLHRRRGACPRRDWVLHLMRDRAEDTDRRAESGTDLDQLRLNGLMPPSTSGRQLGPPRAFQRRIGPADAPLKRISVHPPATPQTWTPRGPGVVKGVGRPGVRIAKQSPTRWRFSPRAGLAGGRRKTRSTYVALPTCTSSRGAGAALGLGEGNRAGELALTIQIVAERSRR